ncbi:acyl-CoA carboxylase subunit epsilon [Streptomyces sp. NPDC005820]|uniref:acyl-CoA carboxylase subunit epsilon n=1 Tax=Streptomyces sp. NPDC005820 TaxID=3157069 RepID=UPI0033F86D64
MTAQTLPRLFRVERGSVTPEELAALSTVLLARVAAADSAAQDAPSRPARAGWRRPERAVGFDGPRTWRAGA